MSSFERWTEQFIGLACSDCDPTLWDDEERHQHEMAGDEYEKAYVFAIPADEKKPDYCPRCGSYLSLDVEEDSLTIHGHLVDRYQAKRESTPTRSYFVESGKASKARDGLDALGISYTERSWQTGIREFLVDASDPAKLDRVFG